MFPAHGGCEPYGIILGPDGKATLVRRIRPVMRSDDSSTDHAKNTTFAKQAMVRCPTRHQHFYLLAEPMRLFRIRRARDNGFSDANPNKRNLSVSYLSYRKMPIRVVVRSQIA